MPKVLVVDNDKDIRRLYCWLFERAEVQAKCFASGAEVLEWLAQPENRVEIIILDLGMPTLDGLTVAEEIRRNEDLSANRRKVEIAFLSGRQIDDAILRVAERCRVKRIFSKSENAVEIVNEIVSWIE